MTDGQVPVLSLYRLIPVAPHPRRADRSAGGFVPLRGLRYCDPLTTATAYGWWVFPPMGFSLMWDGGMGMLWTPEGADEWYPLKYAQFPNFRGQFEGFAPDDVKQFPPPMLAAPNEPGMLQIWSGWFARTRPGWSLLVRSPANFPREMGLDCFEGMIATDTWFGPLFINLRLTKTDVPIAVRAEFPLMQITPIFREHYSDRLLNDVQVFGSPDDWTIREWDAFRRTVVEPQNDKDRKIGSHAISARRMQRTDGPAGSAA